MVRINKYLANCNLGSRRKVEDLVTSGTVKINNKTCTDLSAKVDPENDIVTVNNKLCKMEQQKIFILLNKPRGYIVSRSDEHNRKTIYDLLPDFATNLHPVGRLDYDSEGLVLLTNDGDITNVMIHPSFKMEKTYKVIIKGQITDDKIQILRNGLKTAKLTTQPAKIFLNHSDEKKSELRVIIKEGKNRQIRKMFESVGYEVSNLKRLQIGEIKLEKLPTGSWRFLRDAEILYLVRQYKKVVQA